MTYTFVDRARSSLDCFESLRELNLADNAICSFSELRNLARLTKLESLSLADDDFGQNPVCRLGNYRVLSRKLLQVLAMSQRS